MVAQRHSKRLILRQSRAARSGGGHTRTRKYFTVSLPMCFPIDFSGKQNRIKYLIFLAHPDPAPHYPKADIGTQCRDVRFVPKADIPRPPTAEQEESPLQHRPCRCYSEYRALLDKLSKAQWEEMLECWCKIECPIVATLLDYASRKLRPLRRCQILVRQSGH